MLKQIFLFFLLLHIAFSRKRPVKRSLKPQSEQQQGDVPNVLAHRADALRHGLRKYFCDQFSNKENIRKHCYARGKGGRWHSSGVGIAKFKEIEVHGSRSAMVQVSSQEWEFRREDTNFASDFHLTMYFPTEFQQLWKTFGVTAEQLMSSLIQEELKSFENPAKGGSDFYQTGDGQFFLKTVKTVPKEGENWWEEHFFFRRPQNERKAKFWTEKDREESGRFRGGFLNYYNEMRERGKQSLLPKYFGLFCFQPKGQAPTLFTIQNGLFPTRLPKMDYKFDLKGSVRKLEEEKARQKLEKGEEPIWWELDFVRHSAIKAGEPEGFFPQGIILDVEQFGIMKGILEKDSQFLEGLTILDYSLLLGIYFVSSKSYSATAEGILAACQHCSESPEGTGKGKEFRQLRIHMGIIDVLQSFNTRKNKENERKKKDPKMPESPFPLELQEAEQYGHHSVVPPADYRKRFMDLLTKVFFKKAEANAAQSLRAD